MSTQPDTARVKIPRIPFRVVLYDGLWFWGVLALFVAFLQRTLWRDVPDDFSATTHIFFGLGYVVFCGVLAAPAAVFSGILGHFFGPRAFKTAIFALGAGTAVFAWADISFYDIYGYHLDGMVLSMLTNPATGDSVVVGHKTILNIALRVIAICAGWGLLMAMPGLSRKLLRKKRRSDPHRPLTLSVVVASAFFSLFFCEKIVFVWSYLQHPAQTLRARALLGPLHITLPAQKLLDKPSAPQEFLSQAPETDAKDAALDCPLHPLVFQKASEGNRPNILFVVIESGHAAAMRPDVAPNIWKLAQEGMSATRHYSGGNSTRFALFTLFYGIYPTYWHAALRSRTGPPLIKAATERGYRFCVASSTDLNFPEFRSTAFVDVPEADIFDKPVGEAWQRDAETTDRVISFISQKNDAPFFAVAFLDSPHIPYRYPPAFEKFAPVLPLEDVDVFTQGVSGEPHIMEQMRNRSFNAISYVDAQVGRIVQAVKDSGHWNNTIIIVVGDHGQEFSDQGIGKGHIGHNGAFTPFQTKTIFAAHFPNRRATRIDRLTCHADIAATLLPLMGVSNPPSDYTNGVSLFEKAPKRHTVLMASWGEAVWTDGAHTVQIGRNSHNRGAVEVFDENYRPVGSADAIPKPIQVDIEADAGARARFLAPKPE